MERFLDQYTDAYRTVMGELPTRMRLNGAMAQHIPWFQEEFGRSRGLSTVAAPSSDLAARGVEQLLRRTDVAPG